jgi:hypothetical protein
MTVIAPRVDKTESRRRRPARDVLQGQGDVL